MCSLSSTWAMPFARSPIDTTILAQHYHDTTQAHKLPTPCRHPLYTPWSTVVDPGFIYRGGGDAATKQPAERGYHTCACDTRTTILSLEVSRGKGCSVSPFNGRKAKGSIIKQQPPNCYHTLACTCMYAKAYLCLMYRHSLDSFFFTSDVPYTA